MERSEEDVADKVALAKLEAEELKPLVQSLTISKKLNSESIKLMQLDSSMLDYIISGKSLCMRGEPNDHAVLCTDTNTYEIKEAETSNSCLLLSQWVWPENVKGVDSTKGRDIVCREVHGIYHAYYELRPSRPRIKKLKELLEINPFQGREYEDGNDAKKFSFEDLQNSIQASDLEITRALDDLQACNIDGFLRILDFDYKFRVFTFIINLVDSNSWPIDRIPIESLLCTLEDLEPRAIIEQCFKWYADPTGLQNNEGDELYCLNEDKVCRLYAEVLLRPAGKFNLQEFLESWQSSVPEGMTTNLIQLQGLALTDVDSTPPVIFFYPLWDLPDDPSERFASLFKIRSKWTQRDIKSYIRDLVTDDKDLNALLTKNTRTSTQGGITLYSSRRPR